MMLRMLLMAPSSPLVELRVLLMLLRLLLRLLRVLLMALRSPLMPPLLPPLLRSRSLRMRSTTLARGALRLF
jgi:hypothetical protein